MIQSLSKGLYELLTAVILLAAVASAQDNAANPLVTVSKNMFAMTAKNDVLRSVDKIPEALWSFQPVPTVRTVAQLFAHIADGQYEFCRPGHRGESVSKNIENTRSQGEIVAALNDAFAYCDGRLRQVDRRQRQRIGPFMGMRITSSAPWISIRLTHGALRQSGHYMRIKGIVPASSEQQPAAAKKQ